MTEKWEAEKTVVVRRQWNHWEEATYRFESLEDVHWSSISGGVQAPTPRPFLHAYVICDAMIDGAIAHSGIHGLCPHRIKVCIVKKSNDPKIFQELVEMAEESGR